MSQPSEFVIRASGVDKAALRHLVCRFPLEFRPDALSEAAQAPDLRQEHQGWRMGQLEEAEGKPSARGWVGGPPPLPAAACTVLLACILCWL